MEAIRGAEEERQTKTANRTNPLDSELIKTKGLLKAPSVRERKDNSASSKRDSLTLSTAKEEVPAGIPELKSSLS